MKNLNNLKSIELTALNNILQQMDAAGFTPKAVIGLTRGGLIPATIVSHALHIPVLPIRWSTRDHAHQHVPAEIKREVWEIITDCDNPEVGDTPTDKGYYHCVREGILIIDDICDSGESFKTLQQEFSGVLPMLRWAALYKREGAGFNPDYVGVHVKGEEWLDFSWEMEGVALAATTGDRTLLNVEDLWPTIAG